MLIQVHRLAHLLDHTVFHNDNAVCHGHCLHLIVRHINGGTAQLPVQLADLASHADSQLSIQIGKRFVHEKQLLILDNCTSQCHSLPLTAGKILRFPITVFRKSQNIDCPVHLLLDFRCRHLHILQTIGNVLFHCHVRIEGVVLKYHRDATISRQNCIHTLSVNVEVAAGDFLKSGNHTKCGRFSAAGRANKGNEFTFLNGKTEIGYGIFICTCIFLTDVLHFNKAHKLALLGTCGNDALYNLLGEKGIDDNNRNGNQGDDSKRLSHGCIVVGCDGVQTDLSGQKIAGREHQ